MLINWTQEHLILSVSKYSHVVCIWFNVLLVVDKNTFIPPSECTYTYLKNLHCPIWWYMNDLVYIDFKLFVYYYFQRLYKYAVIYIALRVFFLSCVKRFGELYTGEYIILRCIEMPNKICLSTKPIVLQFPLILELCSLAPLFRWWNCTMSNRDIHQWNH